MILLRRKGSPDRNAARFDQGTIGSSSGREGDKQKVTFVDLVLVLT
jgi:hypothetical protein